MPRSFFVDRMSDDNPESLFSLQLLVENIQLERRCKAARELALGVRLLDFPTLFIYQPQKSAPAQRDDPKLLEYAFNRGKSCFFKMNLSSLHIHLTSSSLHALVLDVTEEMPRLLGSCLLSVAESMNRIWQDVTERGSSHPSSHGERRIIGICNISGGKVGTISLSYKLVYLGTSLLPHIREKGIPAGPPGCEEEHLPTDPQKQTEEVFIEDTNATSGDSFEEELTLFCPPQLYYCSAAHENCKSEDHNLDFESFRLLDSASENENKKSESPTPQGVKVTIAQQTSNSQSASGGTQTVLREALRQLPLLNALVAELSQLYGESPHQDSSVYPRQASSAGHKNTTQELPQPLHTSRQSTSPSLFHVQPSPSSSKTHIIVKKNQEETFHQNRSCNKSNKSNLVYGTTKTFNLRLKQISSIKGRRRECMEVKSQTAPRTAKGKLRSDGTILRSSKKKSLSSLSPGINENPETEIQRLTMNSVLQETSTVRQKAQRGRGRMEQGRHAQGISEKAPRSPGDLKCINIPSMDTDSSPWSKDKHEHHSKSDQSESEPDRDQDKIESSQSSRRGSTKFSFSDASVHESEEVDYTDDFDNLESSDACSPDPWSSPEPSRVKTPKSPDTNRSESISEGVQRRSAPLPAPVKAPRSPHRTLMETHIIRPRTHGSALSFSSDEDWNEPSSSQTILSKKQMLSRNNQKASYSVESSAAVSGEKSTQSVAEVSSESISSFSAQEAEGLQDEVGTLDFRKNCHHVSELVISKLPGYTM